MQARDGVRLHSAGNLVGHLECRHLATLSITHFDTRLKRAVDEVSAKHVQDKGFVHEGAYLESPKASGLRISDISGDGVPAELVQATREAMRAGHDIPGQWAGQ